MIGIIVAAGEGIRLGHVCKALVEISIPTSVGKTGLTMIDHVLNNMYTLGMSKIIIIVNGDEVEKVCGKEFSGIPLVYVQQKERKGIAHAILQTEQFVNENMFIMFTDIIFDSDYSELLNMTIAFDQSDLDMLFATKFVKNKTELCKSYGITYSHQVIEKPDAEALYHMKSLLGLGLYMATPKLFDYIRNTPVTATRNEIELTKTIDIIPYAKKDNFVLTGYYKNINTKEDLEEVNGRCT